MSVFCLGHLTVASIVNSYIWNNDKQWTSCDVVTTNICISDSWPASVGVTRFLWAHTPVHWWPLHQGRYNRGETNRLGTQVTSSKYGCSCLVWWRVGVCPVGAVMYTDWSQYQSNGNIGSHTHHTQIGAISDNHEKIQGQVADTGHNRFTCWTWTGLDDGNVNNDHL